MSGEAGGRRARRVGRGELISAAGAIALLVLMFAFKWFGLAGAPGRTQATSSENAWTALSVVRWLMLLTIAVALGSLFLHAAQSLKREQTDTGRAVAGVGGLTALLLVYRVLIELPNPAQVIDQKLGAFLGLLSAIAIAYGGYESILAERDR